MKDKIIVIGGGPAGIEAAYQLAMNDHEVVLLEKENQIGGNVKNWVKLFPDFSDAAYLKEDFANKVRNENITVKTDTVANKISQQNNKWEVETNGSERITGDAVLLSTGFEPFNAKRKEEWGYGIYDNVITSVDFEKLTKSHKIITAQGNVPKRIAFLNCVGSRDEKVGNNYCSRACCINAVKQAIEYKELVPDGEAYIFYMDLRMSGQCYEELYRTSQENFSVNYVRGRISEASGTIDKRIQIKAEDTLAGLPMKITVDMLVLMVGMQASQSTAELSEQLGIKGDYGFAESAGMFTSDNKTAKEGFFLAGTCKRPLTIPETLADARAAAVQIIDYLKK